MPRKQFLILRDRSLYTLRLKPVREHSADWLVRCPDVQSGRRVQKRLERKEEWIPVNAVKSVPLLEVLGRASQLIEPTPFLERNNFVLDRVKNEDGHVHRANLFV